MKIAALLAATALLGAANTYAADAPPDAFKAKGCMNCHAMDAKKVGPSVKDIAAKHKDDKNAVADLSAKLKSGKGHPKVSASDDDVKGVVSWMLNQK